MRATHEHIVARNWDAVRNDHAVGVTFEDHRPAVGHVVRGRDAILESARVLTAERKQIEVIADLGVAFRTHIQTLDVRGDRLCLTLHVFTAVDDDHAGLEIQLLMVTAVTEDGKIARSVTYDPDDRDAALAELEACWTASAEAAE